MTAPKSEVIKYRLKKAKEALEEAEVMAGMDHWHTGINRLYYAAFYAVTALLLQQDFSSSKHSGVRSFFNSRFIATGIIAKEHGELYNLLFKYRQQSDYEDFFSIDEDTIKQWIEQTKAFVEALSRHIGL